MVKKMALVFGMKVFIGLMVIILMPCVSHGFTDPRDVFAINDLYTSLEFPPLVGWLPVGGDPCLEAWQGVQCVNSNITGIVLRSMNLGGVLGTNLDSFTSMITMDLSDNHIGGSIPDNLPFTMKSFFLSSNQLTGSIPNNISFLSQLTDLFLNNNHLTGELPDAFLPLSSLVDLNLSGNNLSGQLPPSMENLLSLTTLELQDNQFSGRLDVLQDLPLSDLDIERNLFSGPIPEKLLRIPNFRKEGNPFNTTVPPSLAPPSPSHGAPGYAPAPEVLANGPSPQEGLVPARTKFLTTKRVVGITVAAVLIFIIIALAVFMRCGKKKRESGIFSKKHERDIFRVPTETPENSGYLSNNQMEKAPEDFTVMPKDEHVMGFRRMGSMPSPKYKKEVGTKRMGLLSIQKEHEIDMTREDVTLIPLPVEKLMANPIVPTQMAAVKPTAKTSSFSSSVSSYTVASLQQYTNSFTEEHRIGRGRFGSVYRAELPNGKILAVKKLDNMACMLQNDIEFLDLVLSMSKLQHVNVVKLEGYCAEHGQRLLIFEYCSNGTLHDALHTDGLTKKLTWNSRIRMALGAARALEYLHEVCHPPNVHWNFKSANVLLDDDFAVRVSDCGMAPLISASSASQLSGQLLSSNGYGAPELEAGTYTYQSDVFSFGVVMLELLTGRKPYDRSRPRPEQFLVRWAIPQLHDIDALSRMVDPSLNGAYPVKSLSRFADIISLCVQSEPEFRPPMSEIVQDLLHMVQREPPMKR